LGEKTRGKVIGKGGTGKNEGIINIPHREKTEGGILMPQCLAGRAASESLRDATKVGGAKTIALNVNSE